MINIAKIAILLTITLNKVMSEVAKSTMESIPDNNVRSVSRTPHP